MIVMDFITSDIQQIAIKWVPVGGIALSNVQLTKKVRFFIDAVRRRLDGYDEDGVLEVLSRLNEQEVGFDAVQQPEPTTLPVLSYFDQCFSEVTTFDGEIARALTDLYPHFRWRQSKAYNDELLGKGFLANYGWCEIIGPNGFFQGDDFLLGLLMLGPHQHYRDHFHPAPELYWPLTSDTEWRKGDEALAPKAAGTVIWHRPNITHATRTCSKPLLTMWSWTKDTATPAKLI